MLKRLFMWLKGEQKESIMKNEISHESVQTFLRLKKTIAFVVERDINSGCHQEKYVLNLESATKINLKGPGEVTKTRNFEIMEKEIRDFYILILKKTFQ